MQSQRMYPLYLCSVYIFSMCVVVFFLLGKIITELTLLLLFLQSSSTRSTCPVISLTQTFADSVCFKIGVLCAPTLNFCWGLREFVSYRGVYLPVLLNYSNLIHLLKLVAFLVI